MKNRIWVVMDETGSPDYVAPVASMCHDHINAAIAEGIADAAKWVVRECEVLEQKREVAPGHCGLCGKPMPPGEEMLKFHGYSGNCPA
jgi:hypothetical protein